MANSNTFDKNLLEKEEQIFCKNRRLHDKIFIDLIHSLETHRRESTLAIISPFKETVKKLQREFQTDKRILKEFIVETIDRIQGMTVDYVILYLPACGSEFALDERRFNVATSRSQSTTLIVSDVRLERLSKFKGRVHYCPVKVD